MKKPLTRDPREYGIDPTKRCIVPMLNERGAPVFQVIIYGRTARDLMTVPNETVMALARKYPAHFSTPFHVKDAPDIDVDKTKRRNQVGYNPPPKPLPFETEVPKNRLMARR